MKSWRWCGVAGVLLLLVACGGGEDADSASGDAERLGGVAQPEPQPQPTAPSSPEVAPLEEPVAVDVSARLRSDRRLLVEGTTNLPDTTRLQVLVEREVSGVRWQERTEVEGGRFAAGPFGPGSGLPDGGYRITVNMPAVSIQPAEVRGRLGDQGEYLSGPLVEESRHGLGRVISASERFLVGSQPRRTTDQVEVQSLE